MRFKQFLKENQMSRDEIFDLAKELFGTRSWELKSFRVLMNGDVEILDNLTLQSKTLTEIPFKMFYASKQKLTLIVDAPLTSFKGLPAEIPRVLTLGPRCKSCKSFEHLPSKIGADLFMKYTPYNKSLSGLDDAVKEIDGGLIMNFDKIKRGGLGLLNIKGLKKFYNETPSDVDFSELPGPFVIIEKYLGKPNEIFECQEELIEAGFEEYAQL